MNVQHPIVDDIKMKQSICYGHAQRMDVERLPNGSWNDHRLREQDDEGPGRKWWEMMTCELTKNSDGYASENAINRYNARTKI